MPLHYEDFHVDQSFTTLGRTISEFDLVQFAAMTGDNSSAHTDEQFAKTSVYGQRLVHGMLSISYALGLISRTLVFEGTGIAFLGMDDVRFHAPVFIGDTMTAKFTVTSMRETRKPDRGIVVRHVEVFNQRQEAVLDFSITGMVLRNMRTRAEA
jgi:acyl dehydratase